MRHCLKFIWLLQFGCLLRGDSNDQNVTGPTETVLTHMTGSCEIFYGHDQAEQAWMHMSLSHRLFNLDVLNEPEMVHFFMARSHTLN